MELKGNKQEVFNAFAEFLEKCNDEETIHCYFSKKQTKKIRSLAQNNMFHGLFSEIGNHLGIDKDEIKENFLKGLFGVKKSQLGIFTSEVAIEPHTSKLNKKQAIKLISGIKVFIEKYGVPCKYTSREFENLINSYK